MFLHPLPKTQTVKDCRFVIFSTRNSSRSRLSKVYSITNVSPTRTHYLTSANCHPNIKHGARQITGILFDQNKIAIRDQSQILWIVPSPHVLSSAFSNPQTLMWHRQEIAIHFWIVISPNTIRKLKTYRPQFLFMKLGDSKKNPN